MHFTKSCKLQPGGNSAISAKNVSEQLIRVGALQNLDKVLLEFRLDPEAELAKLGMSTIMLEDGELLMNISTVGALLEHCAEVTDCPDFSLRLAAAQDLSLVGVLGLFLQTASTLGEALQEVCQYNHTNFSLRLTSRDGILVH